MRSRTTLGAAYDAFRAAVRTALTGSEADGARSCASSAIRDPHGNRYRLPRHVSGPRPVTDSTVCEQVPGQRGGVAARERARSRTKRSCGREDTTQAGQAAAERGTWTRWRRTRGTAPNSCGFSGSRGQAGLVLSASTGPTRSGSCRSGLRGGAVRPARPGGIAEPGRVLTRSRHGESVLRQIRAAPRRPVVVRRDDLLTRRPRAALFPPGRPRTAAPTTGSPAPRATRAVRLRTAPRSCRSGSRAP